MSRIRPAKFVHVVYRTRRFDQMIKWYETVFDARVQFQNPVLAFLTYDDEHHRFAFANLSALDPAGGANDQRGAVGVDHVAYTFASLNDLFEHYQFLKGRGIKPYWCIHHGITVSMYFGDPDGNQMEFQVDCFKTNDEANTYMYGPHFSVNPIGVEYDPEQWLARMRAGAPLAEFLTRPVDLPVSPVRSAKPQH